LCAFLAAFCATIEQAGKRPHTPAVYFSQYSTIESTEQGAFRTTHIAACWSAVIATINAAFCETVDAAVETAIVSALVTAG
jgi:hypothetical protein